MHSLVFVARAAYALADNTEVNGATEAHLVDPQDMAALSGALDGLDEMPDPPGEAATGPRKAEYWLGMSGAHLMQRTAELYYFGCVQGSGHYLHYSERGNARSGEFRGELQERFGRNGERLDGMFCPPVAWGCNAWMESRVGDWTIVSMWDKSVDTRPDSHSTFMGKTFADGEALLVTAEVLFPEIMRRLGRIQRGPV